MRVLVLKYHRNALQSVKVSSSEASEHKSVRRLAPVLRWVFAFGHPRIALGPQLVGQRSPGEHVLDGLGRGLSNPLVTSCSFRCSLVLLFRLFRCHIISPCGLVLVWGWTASRSAPRSISLPRSFVLHEEERKHSRIDHMGFPHGQVTSSFSGLTPQGFTRLEASYNCADLGQARGPLQSISFRTKVFLDGCAGQAPDQVRGRA